LLIPNAIYKGGGIGGAAQRALTIFRQSGVCGVWRSVRVLLQGKGPPLMADASRADQLQYQEWVNRYDLVPSQAEQIALRAQIDAMPSPPVFALVMPLLGRGDESLLKRSLDAVRGQIYPHWQLHVAIESSAAPPLRALALRYAGVDARIQCRECDWSAAANAVQAPWALVMGAQDCLAPTALLRLAEAIVRDRELALIYSDEDRIDATGARLAPYFKPDWNMDLLRSQNYVSRLACFSTTRVREVGGFQPGRAAEYDLILRCTEGLPATRIAHIPTVLYHRKVTAAKVHALDPLEYAPAGGEEALRRHLQRLGVAAGVQRDGTGFRVRYALPVPPPLVSLIIPTRNGLQLVRRCIESIAAKTTYAHYEIILVDNGSDDAEALAYFAEVSTRLGVRVLRDDRPFNYSQLNNQAATVARGQVLGLINNDVEVISPGWLEELVSIALQPGVGAVGARLWYPDMRLQHGGVVLGYGGVANHAHLRLPRGERGYFGRAALVQNFSAVTAACLVVRKSLYEQVGGLDEVHLKVAYNDVDFCLRLRANGLRNVWTPYAELLHCESATRPSDFLAEGSPEQVERFRSEGRCMVDRWGALLSNDPAYNPNLTLEAEDFSLAWPPRQPLVTP
jgi:GT2 family glycosyltransferase